MNLDHTRKTIWDNNSEIFQSIEEYCKPSIYGTDQGIYKNPDVK